MAMILSNKIFVVVDNHNLHSTFTFVSIEDTVSLYNLEFYSLRLYTTDGGSSIFNLLGKRFFTLSKWSMEHGFT